MMNTVTGKITKGPSACATCARAKSRCVPGPDGRRCERCHRLDKPCSSQTPAPPRKRKEPKPTRVAELERRLEELTARVDLTVLHPNLSPSPAESNPGEGLPGLATPTATASPSSTGLASKVTYSSCHTIPFGHIFPREKPPPIGSHLPTPEEAEGGNGIPAPALATLSPPQDPLDIALPLPLQPLKFPIEQPQQMSQPPLPPPPPPPAASPSSSQHLWPGYDEAEELLLEYRAHATVLFPFAIVPPGLTARQMRHERPFFWRAFMVQACHLDGSRQMALGNALLREISEAVLTRPQCTLDLLQGLQLLISWYHYNLNSFQMTNLLFLARSLCVSLGFTGTQNIRQAEYTSAYLEQLRAFVGTYYLITVIFTTTKKPEALMATSGLEACCRVLEQQMEYPTDELLVCLVRAQQITQSISTTLALRSTLVNEAQMPLSIIIKSFRQQLDTFRDSLPQHVRDDPSFIGHRHVAEMLLYETGLQNFSNGNGNSNGTNGSTNGGSTVDAGGLPLPERLDLLWSCLHTAKAFMANKFTAKRRHATDDPHFICMSTFDFLYVFLIYIRLITFDAPGWDLALVRRELGFDELAERQIADMECMAESRRLRRFGQTTAPATQNGHHQPRRGAGSEAATTNGHGAISTHHGHSNYGAAAARKASAGPGDQTDQDDPDPFNDLAHKLRKLVDMMNSDIGGMYHPGLAAAASKAPMTILDATQEVAQQLENNSLWQDLLTAQDWTAYDLASFTWLY